MSQKHYLIAGGGSIMGSHLTKRILKEGLRATIKNTIYGIALSCSQNRPKLQPEI